MGKLQHNGIRGVMHSWFKSYLSNGKQYVSVKNSSLSVKHYIRCSAARWFRFVHFADDTTVFASDSDINNVHATVNRELVVLDN